MSPINPNHKEATFSDQDFGTQLPTSILTYQKPHMHHPRPSASLISHFSLHCGNQLYMGSDQCHKGTTWPSLTSDLYIVRLSPPPPKLPCWCRTMDTARTHSLRTQKYRWVNTSLGEPLLNGRQTPLDKFFPFPPSWPALTWSLYSPMQSSNLSHVATASLIAHFHIGSPSFLLPQSTFAFPSKLISTA